MEAGRRSVQASMARSLTCTRIPAMFLLVLLLFLGDCSTPTAHGVMEDNGGFGGSHVHSSFLNYTSGGLPSKSTIVRGGAIKRSAAPYQVYIEALYPAEGKVSSCGGTLIDSKYVVSAAHCIAFTNAQETVIFRAQAKHLAVRVGSVYMESGGEVIGVQRLLQHPSYVADPNLGLDLLLIELSRPVKISWDVIPIKLAWDDRKLVKNADIAISGWGLMRSGGQGSQVLRGTTVNRLDDFSCTLAFPGGFNSDTMICAGCSQGGVSSCQGDSGGPAVVSSSSSGCPILVGAISFGRDCGETDVPSVDARISAGVDWLESKAQKSFRTPYALAPRMNCDACSTEGAGSCGWDFDHHRCLAEGWVASAFIFRLLPCSTGPEARMHAYFDPSSLGSSAPAGRVCFLQGRSGDGFSVLRAGSGSITVRLRGPVIYRCVNPTRKGYWSMRWTSQGLSPCSSTYRYAAVFVSGDMSVIEVSYPAAYT